MKKYTRRSILFPVVVSIITTIVVFAVAEYGFHIPSSLLGQQGNVDDRQGIMGEKKWTRTLVSDTTQSGTSLTKNDGTHPGELVLWPSYPEEQTTTLASGSTTGAIVPSKPEVKQEETKVEDTTACTLEYFPVCGANGTTYSNPCMANRAKTIVAHEGGCASGATSTSKISEEIVTTETGIAFDTGSYVLYQNASYSFYLPKYAYYSGYGAQSGAAHTLAVGLTATSTDAFDSSDIRVMFYRAEPAEAPAGKKITVANGVLYVEGDMSNAKIAKIIDTIGASAK